jgi:hypothetical protein
MIHGLGTGAEAVALSVMRRALEQELGRGKGDLAPGKRASTLLLDAIAAFGEQWSCALSRQ